MLFSRRLLRSPVAVAAVAAGAAMLALSCKDKPAENAVDAAASTTPVASSGAPLASAPPATSASSAHEDGDKRGGHGGPGAMLFQAARALDLKPEQKAKVEAAEKSAHGGDGGAGPGDAMKDAAKGLHADLIAGIKAGKIDTAKLEPHYAAIEKVSAGMHQKEADALTALHGALDATQRKAVTASVRARAEKRDDKREDMKDRKDEHIKNVVEAGGPDGGHAGGGHAGGVKRSVDRLTRGLELDADQQKKVDAISAKEDTAPKFGRFDPEELKKSMEAMLVAFEKDTFDAKKLEMFDTKKARAPMEQETKLLVQLLPILKPEQREKLAARMEKGPSPHGRRGPGHRGGGGSGDDD